MLSRDRRYAADRARQIEECAEETVRLYLPQKFPIIGKEEVMAALQKKGAPIQFAEPKANISRGGDLGYVWGEYSEGPGARPTGDYLRIWRKDRAGIWKLALDLVHPR